MLSLPKLEKRTYNGLDFYTDETIYAECGIRVAFLTRHGGVSENCFSSLNLGLHVDDNLQTVNKNRQIVIDALAKNPKNVNIYSPRQVHGDKVVEIIDDGLPDEVDADGVICNTNNVAPLLCFADCCPVILVADNGVFAVVHAGWRGVVNKISAKTLNLMTDKYGCDIASINAYVGPHLRQCSFEVGEDVAETFVHEFGSEVVEGSHVSMVKSLKIQLMEKGLKENRFCYLGFCTKCNDDAFFSYRATGGKCGRHGAIAFKE